eukprot:scaffold66791_cov17-Tisochrysis_lutea.AAC.1
MSAAASIPANADDGSGTASSQDAQGGLASMLQQVAEAERAVGLALGPQHLLAQLFPELSAEGAEGDC